MREPSRPIVAAEMTVLGALHAEGLLAAAAALPEGLHVAGATLADARRRSGGLPRLCLEAGCRTFRLDGDEMEDACAIACEDRLDVVPAAALSIAWARRRSAVLLTADDALASAASARGVTARGLPWIAARVLSASDRAVEAARGAAPPARRMGASRRR